MLVEVMIGALILAITSFAVMSGLEGAQRTGRVNKERSVAATLAQQDIERLRAYPITALSNFSQSRTVSVAGVPYSVQSDTEWIRDTSGVLNCTDDTAQADYLKISSTVRSTAQTTPVKEASLLTPAAGSFSSTAGTLVVKITNRDGTPLSGVSVALSGTGSHSDTTNSEGCAIFGYITAGDYDVDIPGRVSWGGDNSSTSQVTVVAAKTSLKQLEVDFPASLRAHFQRPDGTAAQWSELQVANAKLPGGIRDFGVATPVTAIDASGLFPFLDGYGVYAGTCAKNNPSFWDPTYFSTAGKGFVTLNPGDFLKDVNVEMGVLTVNVKNSTTPTPANMSGALVTVRQGDSGGGCTLDALMSWANTDSSGNVTFVLPFGTYRLCASGVPTGSTIRHRFTVASGSPAHPRLSPPAQKTQSSNLQVPNSGSGTSGACSVTP
jgi:type II secretory pathway pseudopilin PulG